MKGIGSRRRSARRWIAAGVFVVALGMLLTRCPANRDGAAGELQQALHDSAAAARSAALALDLYDRHRSTEQLTSVQVSDARDEAVKAYKTVAELRPDNASDAASQRQLLAGISSLLVDMNSASAVVRTVTTDVALPAVRGRLLAAADDLEKGRPR